MKEKMLLRRLIAGHNRSKVSDPVQLQQMLRHLGMVAENVEDAVAIISPGNIVHFANTAWAQMHGWKNADEILGRSIDEFFPPAGRRNIKNLIKQAKDDGHCDLMGQHQQKEGAVFSTWLKMRTLKDDLGRCEGIAVFARRNSTPVRPQHPAKTDHNTVAINCLNEKTKTAKQAAQNSLAAGLPDGGLGFSQLKELKEVAELAKRLT